MILTLNQSSKRPQSVKTTSAQKKEKKSNTQQKQPKLQTFLSFLFHCNFFFKPIKNKDQIEETEESIPWARGHLLKLYHHKNASLCVSKFIRFVLEGYIEYVLFCVHSFLIALPSNDHLIEFVLVGISRNFSFIYVFDLRMMMSKKKKVPTLFKVLTWLFTRINQLNA